MNLLKYPISRRHFAKGVGAVGVAGYLLNPLNNWQASRGQTPTSTTATTAKSSTLNLVLVSNSEAQTAFLRGAQSAQPSQPIKTADTATGNAYLTELDALLSTQQPARVIGLVDNANAALVLSMARRHGAQLAWLGQHNSAKGHSQHQLISANTTKDCAVAWGRHIDACGVSFTLRGSTAHSRMPTFALTNKTQPLTPSDDWATSLGYLLAAIDHDSALPATPLVPSNTPLQGQFVSFVIQA